MTKFKFVPNQLARDAFNLTAPEYIGDGMTPVLREALGEDNYDKYVWPDGSFCGGESSAEVKITLNPEETNRKLVRSESIGMMYKLD